MYIIVLSVSLHLVYICPSKSRNISFLMFVFSYHKDDIPCQTRFCKFSIFVRYHEIRHGKGNIVVLSNQAASWCLQVILFINSKRGQSIYRLIEHLCHYKDYIIFRYTYMSVCGFDKKAWIDYLAWTTAGTIYLIQYFLMYSLWILI